jgi:fatty acid amide hydrolase 2
MFAVGPMGKSVRDMRFMYQLIANRPIEPNHLLNFKVEILPGSIDYPLSLTTIQVLDEIEGFLGKSLTTKRTIPPFFDDSAKLWQEIIASSDSKVLERGAYNNDRTGIMKGLIKERIAEKTSVKPSLTKGIFASKIFKPSAKRVREIQQILDQGDERLKTYLKNRLLIFPVYHSAAPKHGKVYREIFSLRKRFLLYMHICRTLPMPTSGDCRP